MCTSTNCLYSRAWKKKSLSLKIGSLFPFFCFFILRKKWIILWYSDPDSMNLFHILTELNFHGIGSCCDCCEVLQLLVMTTRGQQTQSFLYSSISITPQLHLLTVWVNSLVLSAKCCNSKTVPTSIHFSEKPIPTLPGRVGRHATFSLVFVQKVQQGFQWHQQY